MTTPLRAVSGILCALLIITQTSAEEAASAVKHVDAKQGEALIKKHASSKDLVILDVRTPKEYAKGHLANAKNIDVLAADFKAEAAKLDKAKSYLVHCRSGKRSQTAVKALQQLGLKKLYHLDGGMIAWQTAKLPVETTTKK